MCYIRQFACFGKDGSLQTIIVANEVQLMDIVMQFMTSWLANLEQLGTLWRIPRKWYGSFIYDKINYGGGIIQLSEEEACVKDQDLLQGGFYPPLLDIHFPKSYFNKLFQLERGVLYCVVLSDSEGS